MIAWPLILDTVRAASRVSAEGRNRQILAAHREGVPAAEIARAARLSVAQTRRIIAANGDEVSA
jgi:hypothetical protein